MGRVAPEGEEEQRRKRPIASRSPFRDEMREEGGCAVQDGFPGVPTRCPAQGQEVGAGLGPLSCSGAPAAISITWGPWRLRHRHLSLV